MSSMQSWTRRLWRPPPARGALFRQPGTLSSMQPSSLAHTSACHCRPFPSDSGFKNCGRYEAPNAAECVSYQRVNQQDHFLESQPCQTYPPPVTFLPQNPYSQPPSNNPMYPGSYPAPGQGQGEAPRPLFPKEQSV